MRSLGLLTAALVMGTAYNAYSQTLNEQMQRMQNQPAPAPAVGAPQGWPANTAVTQRPAVTAPQAAPIQAPPVIQHAPAVVMQQQPAPVAPPRAPETIDSVGGGAIPALPLEIMTSGGVVYVSGGIGDEELEMLKSHEHEFNVRILMSAPQGEYLSNVALRILDNKETPLVQINDAGPYVYARMMPGTYFVETTASSGEKKKTRLTVGEKGVVRQHIVFSE